MNILTLFTIAIGGATGALLRYGVGLLIPHSAVAIFLVNIVGCAMMGLLMNQALIPWATKYYYFLVIGILGSFTTYSAFSFETIMLIKKGQLQKAALYILLTISCCLGITLLAASIQSPIRPTH